MRLLPLIQDLAIILGSAGVISLFFQRIRQPVVLGYLLVGTIVGPHTPPFSLVLDLAGIHAWADLGVIFLMFTLGLEFSFRRLISAGPTALVAGPFEALMMLGLGYAAGRFAGLSATNSIYLGGILSISSTTIIVKTLEEMRLKTEAFAHTIFAVLVVEDVVGILILVGLTSLAEGGGFEHILISAAKLLVLVCLWVIFGTLTVPAFLDRVGRKAGNETMILLALGLCLGLVVFSTYFHYSAALGAFVMGMIIGESREYRRIEKLMLPIKSVFGAVFFVSIGMLLDPASVARHWTAVLGVTLLTIGGKIVATTLGVRLSGKPLGHALRVGFALAQTGEFSFIIAGLGLGLGVMDPTLYSIAVSVTVITTFSTPYLIRFSSRFGSGPGIGIWGRAA